ncbi:MAG: FecR domain-containing protein [Pseudomonadota bacterium]
MPNPDRLHLAEQAADIFTRLQEHPDDPELIRERDAFLARGEAERQVYSFVLKAWKGTAVKRRGPRIGTVAVIACMLVSAFLLARPAQIYLTADHLTQRQDREVVLLSGDISEMDASTALVDRTDERTRRVELLKGAAYFDVETAGGRPFEVIVGDLRVQVVGTAFETASFNGITSIAVSEGIVEVTEGENTWVLNAGQQLQWSKETGAVSSDIATGEIASWRDGRLVTKGMKFAQVAEAIERRLPGHVVIIGDDLANSLVAGSVDLSEPDVALRTLATAKDARVVSVSALITVVVAK